MRIRTIVLVVVLLVLAFGVGRLSAAAPSAPGGNLDSPGPPGSTSSYTLEDIYDRLDSGAAGTQSTFAEPAAGPTTGTGHTLNEVYDLIGLRAPVPKTGAGDIGGYTEVVGEDGHVSMRRGVGWPTPRFVTSTVGIVTDTLTGLIWLENASCGGTENWSDALTFANSLYDGWTGDGSGGDCGLSDGSSPGDWRLPNVRELHSLVHYGFWNPAVSNTAGTGQWTTDGDPFTGVQSSNYWSSTTIALGTWAWNVYLYDGSVALSAKTNTYYVLPVRGGQ